MIGLLTTLLVAIGATALGVELLKGADKSRTAEQNDEIDDRGMRK